MNKKLIREMRFMMERLESPRMTDTELNKRYKKLLKEGDWDFINDFDIPKELFVGATEVQNGYFWSIDNYDDFRNIYNALESMSGLKWSIALNISGGGKFFESYLNRYGNFNIFIPSSRDNVYGWFDGMPKAYDKNSKVVNIPI